MGPVVCLSTDIYDSYTNILYRTVLYCTGPVVCVLLDGFLKFNSGMYILVYTRIYALVHIVYVLLDAFLKFNSGMYENIYIYTSVYEYIFMTAYHI